MKRDENLWADAMRRPGLAPQSPSRGEWIPRNQAGSRMSFCSEPRQPCASLSLSLPIRKWDNSCPRDKEAMLLTTGDACRLQSTVVGMG